MKILLITSGVSFILYIIVAVYMTLINPKLFFNLIMEHPVAVAVTSRLWWISSLLVFFGTIGYHFLVKYW